MTIEESVYLGQMGLLTVLYIGGPLLLTALVVGSVVSVLQAVTQVQEVTLVFVPKIVAVFAVLAFAGGWMLQQAVAYGVLAFQGI